MDDKKLLTLPEFKLLLPWAISFSGPLFQQDYYLSPIEYVWIATNGLLLKIWHQITLYSHEVWEYLVWPF